VWARRQSFLARKGVGTGKNKKKKKGEQVGVKLPRSSAVHQTGFLGWSSCRLLYVGGRGVRDRERRRGTGAAPQGGVALVNRGKLRGSV